MLCTLRALLFMISNPTPKLGIGQYLSLRLSQQVGKCGRCDVGEKYVCKDGRVFSWAELDKLTKEY
jgi:NAD(P)H-flavin reductase